MVELFLLVCMVGQPNICRTTHLSYSEESVTLLQCTMYGQVEVAKWASEHPEWRIARWSCAPARQEANI